jgi:hypothetical protein
MLLLPAGLLGRVFALLGDGNLLLCCLAFVLLRGARMTHENDLNLRLHILVEYTILIKFYYVSAQA